MPVEVVEKNLYCLNRSRSKASLDILRVVFRFRGLKCSEKQIIRDLMFLVDDNNQYKIDKQQGRPASSSCGRLVCDVLLHHDVEKLITQYHDHISKRVVMSAYGEADCKIHKSIDNNNLTQVKREIGFTPHNCKGMFTLYSKLSHDLTRKSDV